jgi:hypothetical protein
MLSMSASDRPCTPREPTADKRTWPQQNFTYLHGKPAASDTIEIEIAYIPNDLKSAGRTRPSAPFSHCKKTFHTAHKQEMHRCAIRPIVQHARTVSQAPILCDKEKKSLMVVGMADLQLGMRKADDFTLGMFAVYAGTGNSATLL